MNGKDWEAREGCSMISIGNLSSCWDWRVGCEWVRNGPLLGEMPQVPFAGRSEHEFSSALLK